jgi:hypothetical protein
VAIFRRALLATLLAPAVAAQGALATPFDLPRLPDAAPLRALGGLEIHRERLGFGGLSGLAIADDLTFTAISDRGRFLEAVLELDEAGRPTALVPRRTGRLGDGAGRPFTSGYTSDAEALARLPDGSFLVAFERWHRIRRYRDLAGPGSYVGAPPGIEAAPSNAGLEALAVLADGRWLAMAEGLQAGGHAAAWLGGPGGWISLAFRTGFAMQAVDAAGLPDGGALVLERSFALFGGFGGRLVHLPAAGLATAGPAALLEGEEWLRLADPLPVDNYEAVAVFRHRGRLLCALLSDDNENRLQRTLLLVFALTAAA